MRNKWYKKLIVGAFLVVPTVSSLISTVHVVDLFGLGNEVWMAFALAMVFELGQLSSLLTLAILDKINKFVVWSIFFLLASMQILGNVYYSFDFVTNKLIEDPNWLGSALELINKFTFSEIDSSSAKFILALVIGIPVPIISIAFLKSLVDYLNIKEHDADVADAKKLSEEVVQKPKENSELETKQPEKQEAEVKQPNKEEVGKVEEPIPDVDDLEKITKEYNDKKMIDRLWKQVNQEDKTEVKPTKPMAEKLDKEVDLGTVKSSFSPHINNG